MRRSYGIDNEAGKTILGNLNGYLEYGVVAHMRRALQHGATKAELLGLKAKVEEAKKPTPPVTQKRTTRRVAKPVTVIAPPPAAPPAPRGPCVEVIRGLTRVTECF